jgi:alkylhydroperoxidase family enzyme
MSPEPKARLEPIARESWDDEIRGALRAAWPAAAKRFLSDAPDAPRLPNVLGTLLHHPEIASKFVQFNRVLLETPVLGPRLRELMVLRVGWRTKAVYEWVQHARMSVDLGISTGEIVAITRDLEVDDWDPVEGLLLQATDELVDDHCISDATWAGLKQHLDDRAIVEAVFTVGAYTLLAMAFNSFGVQLDPGLEPPPGVPIPD